MRFDSCQKCKIFLFKSKGKTSCMLDQCLKANMGHKGIDYSQNLEENETGLSRYKAGSFKQENIFGKTHFLLLSLFVLA